MAAIENEIYVGSLENPTYYFDNSRIFGGASVSQSVSVVSQELAIDKFSPTVADDEDNLAKVDRFISSDNYQIKSFDDYTYVLDEEPNYYTSEIINIAAGTPVWYYADKALVGKFYIDSITRTGRNRFVLDCVSDIGLLDKMYHAGGYYSTATFSTVIAQILASDIFGTGSAVIDYILDDDVASLTVSGFLPYATKRENLHQLIFAYGVNILRDPNGKARFTFIHTSPDDAEVVSIEKTYDTGEMTYEKPYSKVSVIEHTYLADTTQDSEVLYDNTTGASVSNETVVFTNSPIIVSTLEVTGTLQVVSSNVNCAIVSGSGTLSGVPYIHTTRTTEKVNSASTTDRVCSVTECTMLNAANSQNLLNRLYAFYCPTDFIKKITNKIVYENQSCGQHYSITNPYNETETALLSEMEVEVSSFNAANITWYAGYVPAGQTGLYQHVAILDAETYEEDEGVFTVPDGVTSIKVVLIGGGTGGSSGYPGENGGDAYTYTNVAYNDDITSRMYGAEGGDGGSGGPGGAAGNVFVAVIDNPSATYNYTIGTGGAGGAATGFIKDTIDELRAAMENEHPGTTYTDAQLQAYIDTESTTWTGTPNAGTAGTASTFGDYSSSDTGSYVPTGGVYDPIHGRYFALTGEAGASGGKGGARQDGTSWTTDGETIVYGDDTYEGGTTGTTLTTVTNLPEATIAAFGGNGAGAAVGLGRTGHSHMDGDSSQSTSWEVIEDE